MQAAGSRRGARRLRSVSRSRRGDPAMAQTEALMCAKCGRRGDGWKCAICGSVAGEHDAGHLHVGSDRYCTIRCAGCDQADVLCTCV